jgi:hypothetical protein
MVKYGYEYVNGTIPDKDDVIMMVKSENMEEKL